MRHWHKFNAKPTEVNGVKFGSKKEAAYYQELLLRQKAGDILFMLMQVPFILPGNVRYLVDFVTFNSDGSVHFIEIKGYPTPMGELKLKQVQALYPIEIEVIRN